MKKLLLLTLFLPSIALSNETTRDNIWSPGFHLLAGLGAGVAFYKTEINGKTFAPELAINTNLTYSISNRVSLELGSITTLTSGEFYLIWSTAFTLGARIKLTESSYLRSFTGYAPTVVFFSGSPPPPFSETGITRLHYNGPLVGGSYGFSHTPVEGKKTWFYELTLFYQYWNQETGIQENGNTPVVIFDNELVNGGRIFTLIFSVGLQLF